MKKINGQHPRIEVINYINQSDEFRLKIKHLTPKEKLGLGYAHCIDKNILDDEQLEGLDKDFWNDYVVPQLVKLRQYIYVAPQLKG